LTEAENRRLMELMRQLDNGAGAHRPIFSNSRRATTSIPSCCKGPMRWPTRRRRPTPDLIKDFFDYSSRDPQSMPPPPALDALVDLQAQTERNTRNIVSVVQGLPNGADAADQLTHADQRMSRA
jgi:hypothetical protein